MFEVIMSLLGISVVFAVMMACHDATGQMKNQVHDRQVREELQRRLEDMKDEFE